MTALIVVPLLLIPFIYYVFAPKGWWSERKIRKRGAKFEKIAKTATYNTFPSLGNYYKSVYDQNLSPTKAYVDDSVLVGVNEAHFFCTPKSVKASLEELTEMKPQRKIRKQGEKHEHGFEHISDLQEYHGDAPFLVDCYKPPVTYKIPDTYIKQGKKKKTPTKKKTQKKVTKKTPAKKKKESKR